MIDFVQRVIDLKGEMPDGWKWFQLDCRDMPDDYVKVTGAVPCGEYVQGKRKGCPKFPKETQTIFIRMQDVRIAEQSWEVETGQCFACAGSGRTCSGFSVATGKTFSECSRCKGTGIGGSKKGS